MSSLINVIGGNGFIGKSLIERIIDDNYTIRVLDIKENAKFNEFYSYCDVRDYSGLLNNIEKDSIIINLAAEHKDNITPKSLYYDVNVLGAKNICKVARIKNINKIIFTSSVAVYGNTNQLIDETGKVSPESEYGKSKYEAEKIYRDWQSENPSKRTLIIIRPTVVFGKDNRGNVYNLFKQINDKLFFMVGSGKNIKSIAYVENLSAFLKFCIDYKSGSYLFNFVDKPNLTMNELLLKVHSILKIKSISHFKLPYFIALCIGYFFDFLSLFTKHQYKISSLRIKKFCSNSLFCSSKLNKTGFNSPIPLDVALRETLIYEFRK